MSAKTLLNAVTTTGASSAEGNQERIIESHAVQATFTGAPTVVRLDLQGSLDGTTWSNLAEHTATADELTDGALLYHVVYKPVIFVRLNLVTLTGGTAPTLTAKYASTLIQVL